jgi:hypothetical protein
MYNLNFRIYHLHFNTVLTEITAFKVELTFREMSKMSKKRPIKVILSTAVYRTYKYSFHKLKVKFKNVY